MKKVFLLASWMMLLTVIFVPKVDACTTCGCTVNMLGKGEKLNTQESQGKWYVNYLYDQLVWRTKSAEEAHDLHDNDHDVHDKTTESTHHLQFGRHVTDDLNVMLDLSYVMRSAIEIEDHDNLGAKQHSRGFGDMQLLSDYRLWHHDQHAINFAGGIKFPTGDTHQKNFQGERFETDMQPGSGAYNYILGAIYNFEEGPISLTANTSYVFTERGAQGFQYGNLYTASLEARYLLNPKAQQFQTKLGIDTVFQDEWKEKTEGVKNPDSGGQTVLMGPSLRINVSKDFNVSGTFLYPVSQQLNGYTQKQAFDWTLMSQLKF